MMYRKMIFGLLAAVVLTACSSTKNLHNVAVPEGSATAVHMPAKKGSMTEEEIREWPHADIYQDSIPGMSLAKAYDFLKDKKGTTVILGVIDSGIDREHEDLKDNIWTNTDEIADNGKDDDNNGYVDDVHGWNFLGGDGQGTPEQLEITRLYKMLTDKYKGRSIDEIGPSEKDDYNEYLKVKKDFEKRNKESRESYDMYRQAKIYFDDVDVATQEKLGKESYYLEDLNNLPEADRNPYLQRILSMGGTNQDAEEQISELVKHFGEQVAMYDLNFQGRTATGDDPYDIKDVPYGNGNTIGSVDDEMHGTHVSGIALATRNNGKGLNGVAQNVKLLSVRAVPKGDEYDKDVALAIRYAVDNGAKVINMSFGKSYSPKKEWVYDAIKYAASKDVLLVHASGNDSKNIDKSDNFPNDAADKITEMSDNVITVSSITRHFDENLVSSFSNYGKLNVDLFAPGSEIYSTVPKNKYEIYQGTSMAAPEVAGVAALIRSYYPELSASQVKHILMNSGIKVDLEVNLPGGEGEKVPFSELSRSGRVLNAYNALKMADAMVNSK